MRYPRLCRKRNGLADSRRVDETGEVFLGWEQRSEGIEVEIGEHSPDFLLQSLQSDIVPHSSCQASTDARLLGIHSQG